MYWDSVYEDPDWDTFALIVPSRNDAIGEGNLLVRYSRSANTNQLRFSRDFGDCPEQGGFRQESNPCTKSGNYVITTTAHTSAPTANAGAAIKYLAGGYIRVTESAAGGTAPYWFRWSLAAGPDSANVAAPTAGPSATTYTLTLTDTRDSAGTDIVLIAIRPSGRLPCDAGDTLRAPMSSAAEYSL